MRETLLKICLCAGIWLAIFTPVHGETFVGEKCNADFVAFVHWDPDVDEQHDAAQKAIDALGIDPSANATVLFEEFTKRFPVVLPVDEQGSVRDVPSILKTRGGTPDELAFVLLNLLTRNGIEAEMVHIHADPKASGNIVGVLVYVPARDQVFDPTLPDAKQHRGSGWSLLEGSARIHYGYPFGTPAHNCPISPIRGYFAKRSPAVRP